jgi:sugar lactone lactonase YvrE
VAGAEKDSAIARAKWFTDQGGKVDRSRIPDVMPAFRSFEVDDEGNLWVEPYVARGDTARRYDVFDPSGRYLGQARSDVGIAGSPRPLFRRGAVYAVVTDEVGIPYVVRARIVRP